MGVVCPDVAGLRLTAHAPLGIAVLSGERKETRRADRLAHYSQLNFPFENGSIRPVRFMQNPQTGTLRRAVTVAFQLPSGVSKATSTIKGDACRFFYGIIQALRKPE